MIRVSALESCGGFPTDSVTEDFLLTLRLDRLGWRTVYLNEPLSVGLAYIERYAPDTTACIFWLKNRRPDLWRDVQGREHAVEMKSPQLSLEERHARSRRLLDEVFAEVSAKAEGVSCGDKAEGV